MDQIPPFLAQVADHRLEARFITEVLNSRIHGPVANAEEMIAAGVSHFENLDEPVLQWMKFFEKALESSNSGVGDDQPSIVNLNIAQIEYRSGDYPTAQQHANEAQKLAKSAGNLLDEARALRIEATCYATTKFELVPRFVVGNYGHASFLFHRAGELVKLCGMSGGTLDHLNVAGKAEVYRLKSEYAEAKKFNMQIAENTSTEKDPYMHASALSNVAEIDIIIGTAEQAVRDNIDKAKIIFQKLEYQLGVTQSKEKLAVHKALLFLGDVFFHSGEKDTGHTLFIVALDEFISMDIHLSRADCMVGQNLGQKKIQDEHYKCVREIVPRFTSCVRGGAPCTRFWAKNYQRSRFRGRMARKCCAQCERFEANITEFYWRFAVQKNISVLIAERWGVRGVSRKAKGMKNASADMRTDIRGEQLAKEMILSRGLESRTRLGEQKIIRDRPQWYQASALHSIEVANFLSDTMRPDLKPDSLHSAA
ncbi:hypothetical protein B0H13DRAFT_1892222 [Mycena leptocephala]|nr:hypothetical protein B0H13DRAFT_1892222 [Mycena leptocephala]